MGSAGAQARCPRRVLAVGHLCEHTLFQVPMLVFGHGAGTRVQGQDLVLVHKKVGTRPLCAHCFCK